METTPKPQALPAEFKPTPHTGWRHMTGVQRYNARMSRIWEHFHWLEARKREAGAAAPVAT